ncbi:hypothetical protein Caci_0047 [Catenulispora acidiphila DSM 44928]|uniref:Putative Flp pilus-assembly TadG-like N-terminal domain-containing protein n=1 Tax=Catenulispora acidiphila (strain DSM 44928 / JCM 14897 / NBRC 102108 / NRRL B-24433 / ID139908) TaxID=479433 RepID=C7QFR3_CATAD|nr:hypothetical protein Caci_0047 [Catenulispora acidiphila DSM 44928]
MPPPNPARDRGSATIYAALLTGLLTTLTGAILALGTAILARHRAGSAADLAALSAATHATPGQIPCDWARRVTTAHHTRLLHCTCNGPTCLVTTAINTPWGAATVTSRAGPADDPTGETTAGQNALRAEGTRLAEAAMGLRAAALSDPVGERIAGIERTRLGEATGGSLRTAAMTSRTHDPVGERTVEVERSSRAKPQATAPRAANLVGRTGLTHGLVGPSLVGIERSTYAEAYPFGKRASGIAARLTTPAVASRPRPSPHRAPVVPAAPLVGVRLAVAESEPLAGSSAASCCQLGAALP